MPDTKSAYEEAMGWLEGDITVPPAITSGIYEYVAALEAELATVKTNRDWHYENYEGLKKTLEETRAKIPAAFEAAREGLNEYGKSDGYWATFADWEAKNK